jgi:hypothetical protein
VASPKSNGPSRILAHCSEDRFHEAKDNLYSYRKMSLGLSPVYCLLIYIEIESFQVTVHDRGASYVDTIEGEARETFVES